MTEWIGYRELREKVLLRDNKTCQLCLKPGNIVHHIISTRYGVLNNINNLMTVCERCHRKFEFGKNTKSEYSGNAIKTKVKKFSLYGAHIIVPSKWLGKLIEVKLLEDI